MSRLVSDAAFADMLALVGLVNGPWTAAPEKLGQIFVLGRRLAPELGLAVARPATLSPVTALPAAPVQVRPEGRAA